jgi:hypothetical protein
MALVPNTRSEHVFVKVQPENWLHITTILCQAGYNVDNQSSTSYFPLNPFGPQQSLASVILIGPKVSYRDGTYVIVRRAGYASLPPISATYVNTVSSVTLLNTAGKDVVINLSYTDKLDIVGRLEAGMNTSFGEAGMRQPSLNYRLFLMPSDSFNRFSQS